MNVCCIVTMHAGNLREEIQNINRCRISVDVIHQIYNFVINIEIRAAQGSSVFK